MLNLINEIPVPVLERMHQLEQRDTKERADGVAQIKRLRQIPPETGVLLAQLALSAPEGTVIEIGTSGAYSSMWIGLAMARRGGKLVTFELLPEKVDLARETLKKSGMEDQVELVHGDARGHLKEYDEIAFCFLDAEKEMYAEFYELVAPKLVPGGLLVADNVISHAEDLEDFVEMARQDASLDAAILPVGKGLLVASKRY